MSASLVGSEMCIRDSVWSELSQRGASGVYDFVFMGTPCETFSRARAGPPGPRPPGIPSTCTGSRRTASPRR
eukprot:1491568-Alexandrium_andersonii.AAC.1